MNDRPSAVPATGKKTLWAWAVGTFFGAGLLKPGPGTWGSVAALLLWMIPAYGSERIIYLVNNSQWILPRYWLGALTIFAALIATAIGIPAATIVARGERPRRSRPRRHRRSRRPVADARSLQAGLAPRPCRARALPPLRHHQAMAHPQAGGAARRLGYHAG